MFDVPDVQQISFLPGQWVSFEEIINGEPITRAYSIASPPEGNRFELCLNRVESGHLSPYLFRMQAGDSLEMKGPYGSFVWRKPPNDSVLVATGTGIAPFRGMLHARLANDASHKIKLLFGVRYERGLLYRAEFEELERLHPNFRFWPTLTRPEPSWQGRTGRVQHHLAEAIGDRRDIDVYICGLHEMVDDVRARLKAMGFERKHIIHEKYD